MALWNHAYDIAFTVVSQQEDGSDVTPEMFRAGLLARIRDLDKYDEWDEVLTAKPFDSYEME